MCSGSKCCWRCPCSGLAAIPARESAPSVEETGTNRVASARPVHSTIAGERFATWYFESASFRGRAASKRSGGHKEEKCRIQNVDTPKGEPATGALTTL